MNDCCVYVFTNKINNKKYVGQTIDFETRIKAHKNPNGDQVFARALKKYGIENFNVETYECAKNELDDLEKILIKNNKSHISQDGYNMTFGGEGLTGYKHTDETKQKNV